MLRGINRSIIEINETENQYFERVLIFVRPEFGSFPESYLQKEAAKLVGGMSTRPVGFKNKKRGSARKRAVLKRRLVCGTLLSAVFLLVIFLISTL
jgi:hypothetical protein